jgi:hypothetical protein
MRDTADVISGKLIAVRSQYISGVIAADPLKACGILVFDISFISENIKILLVFVENN